MYLLPLHAELPHYQHPDQSGTFVATILVLKHHYHQSPWCTLEVTLDAIYFMGLDKCIMYGYTAVVLYTVFSLPQKFSALLIQPFLPLALDNH